MKPKAEIFDLAKFHSFIHHKRNFSMEILGSIFNLPRLDRHFSLPGIMLNFCDGYIPKLPKKMQV